MPDADFVAAGAISWSVPSRHSRLEYLEELLGTGPLGSALPGIDAIRDASSRHSWRPRPRPPAKPG